jgi:hypothetical protein
VLWIRIREPGSNAFLTPGSGSGTRDERKIRIRVEHLRSFFPRAEKQFLRLKILQFFEADPDPGSGTEKFGSGNRGKHPGSAAPLKIIITCITSVTFHTSPLCGIAIPYHPIYQASRQILSEHTIICFGAVHSVPNVPVKFVHLNEVRIRILLSSSKSILKNNDSYCFGTSLRLFIFEK